MKAYVIMIAGEAGAGKDTSADYIIGQFTETNLVVVKVGLADRLKLACQGLIKMFHGVTIPIEDFHDSAKKEAVREDLPPFDGQPFRLRTVLQRVATMMREVIFTSLWCEAVKQAYADKADLIVISDARQQDEIDYFARLAAAGEIEGMSSFRVIRPTKKRLADENASHKSEVGVASLKVDEDIVNDGSIADLHTKLAKYVGRA
jgi:hypothetical protein